jgi:hypothetical protein
MPEGRTQAAIESIVALLADVPPGVGDPGEAGVVVLRVEGPQAGQEEEGQQEGGGHGGAAAGTAAGAGGGS